MPAQTRSEHSQLPDSHLLQEKCEFQHNLIKHNVQIQISEENI